MQAQYESESDSSNANADLRDTEIDHGLGSSHDRGDGESPIGEEAMEEPPLFSPTIPMYRQERVTPSELPEYRQTSEQKQAGDELSELKQQFEKMQKRNWNRRV